MLPAAPDHRVSRAHQEAIASVSIPPDLVPHRGVIQHVEAQLPAPVDHVVQQHAVAAGRVGRAQDHHVGRGLHQPIGVARCQRQVGDARIVRVVRVQADRGAGGDAVIGAGGPEAAPVEGGTHGLQDVQPQQPGLCGRGKQHEHDERAEHDGASWSPVMLKQYRVKRNRLARGSAFFINKRESDRCICLHRSGSRLLRYGASGASYPSQPRYSRASDAGIACSSTRAARSTRSSRYSPAAS